MAVSVHKHLHKQRVTEYKMQLQQQAARNKAVTETNALLMAAAGQRGEAFDLAGLLPLDLSIIPAPQVPAVLLQLAEASTDANIAAATSSHTPAAAAISSHGGEGFPGVTEEQIQAAFEDACGPMPAGGWGPQM